MTNVDLKDSLIKISELVEPVINGLLAENTDALSTEIALYQCRSGGKRIRPALLIASGQLFGAKTKQLLRPAAAIEILHNATLITDDIIDHSEFRRNEPTCWNKFGTSMAECASFMYLASVFGGLHDAENTPRLVKLYSDTLKTIVNGEIKDILFERSGREDEKYVIQHRYHEISHDAYFTMIGQKTAVLLQACCKAGAICANASDNMIEVAGDFGFNLGLAFQVRDDVLDIFGDEKEFGKQIGKDIIEKKMGNYVVLLAIEQLDQQDKDILRGILEGHADITDQDVKTATNLINKTNAKAEAEDFAISFINKSFEALDKLPQNEHTELLAEIARYVIGRNK